MVLRRLNKKANKYLFNSPLNNTQVEKLIRNYIYNKSVREIGIKVGVSPTTVQQNIKLIDKRISELDILNCRVVQIGSQNSQFTEARQEFWKFRKKHYKLTIGRLKEKRFQLPDKLSMKNMHQFSDEKLRCTSTILASTIALKFADESVTRKDKTMNKKAAHIQTADIFVKGLRISGPLNQPVNDYRRKEAMRLVCEEFAKLYCFRTQAKYWSLNCEIYYEIFGDSQYTNRNQPAYKKQYQEKIKKRNNELKKQ